MSWHKRQFFFYCIYDSILDTFSVTKEETYKKVGEANDKVYEVAKNAHNTIVNNIKFGVNKTMGMTIDVAKKAEETRGGGDSTPSNWKTRLSNKWETTSHESTQCEGDAWRKVER